MNVTCGNVTKLPYANQMKLVAGSAGAGNEIRWVHYLEEPKYVEWLKGGELIIISGVVTSDREDQLVQLLQQLFEKNTAGVVINLSYYIEKIPEAVIEYGNRMGYPVFEMPARVRIVDVSQSICLAIFKNQKYDSDVDWLMGDIVCGKRLSYQRACRFQNLGYDETQPYRAVVFTIRRKTGAAEEQDLFYEENATETLLQNLKVELKRRLPPDQSNFICVFENRVIWMPRGSAGRDSLREVCRGAAEVLSDAVWAVGVGDTFKGLKHFRQSIEHAETALETGLQDEEAAVQMAFYEEMIDSRLFAYVPNQVEKKRMAGDILGELLKPEHAELLHILEVYFQSDCNARSAAAALYLHVNTMRYKLQRIEELLHRDLSSTEERFKVLLALKLLKNIKKEL